MGKCGIIYILCYRPTAVSSISILKLSSDERTTSRNLDRYNKLYRKKISIVFNVSIVQYISLLYIFLRINIEKGADGKSQNVSFSYRSLFQYFLKYIFHISSQGKFGGGHYAGCKEVKFIKHYKNTIWALQSIIAFL